MSWEKGAHITSVVTSILQLLLFAFSIYLIVRQLQNQNAQLEKQGEQMKQQTDLARVANTQALVSLSSPFNLELARDGKLADLWAKDWDGWNCLTPSKQEQYRNMIIWWLVFYENIFFQEKSKLLDQTIFNAWKEDIRSFVIERSVEKVWPSVKAKYHEDFVCFIDASIKEKKDRAAAEHVGKDKQLG